jgi:hypothetical protein
MKNSILSALFGLAAIAAIPAFAATSNFDFTGTGGNPFVTAGGVTATAYAFEATGTTYSGSNPTAFTSLYGPTSNGNNAPSLGVYSGDGLGICEGSNQNSHSDDCSAPPNHQIDNGPNNVNSNAAACSASNPCDYEFMLIQFTAAINLSQIQLGNFGSTGSATDPFAATYWTSSSALGVSAIESNLEATTVGNVANTDNFSTETQTSCTTGVTALGGGQNGNGATYNDNCLVNGNGVDNVSGSGVTYLLIGASVASGQSGQDFFKIQDLSFNSATPEPATFGLIGLSLAGLGLLRRKRKLLK